MKERLRWPHVSSGAYKALFAFSSYSRESGLDRKLLDLVQLRASQINRCAYCIDMHWKDLRSAGKTEQSLYGLDAWRESPYYSDRERAVLAWTEAVTVLAEGFIPDAVYDRARSHFSEKELVDLTAAIVIINGWNRMNVAFRTEAGNYQPPRK
jgi:AhpD family alkylhydroperoxidase